MSSLSFSSLRGPAHLRTMLWSASRKMVVGKVMTSYLLDDGAGRVGADGVGEAELLDELLALIHGVEAELLDCDEGDLALVGLEGGLEVGHLKSARGARGIPEIQARRAYPQRCSD